MTHYAKVLFPVLLATSAFIGERAAAVVVDQDPLILECTFAPAFTKMEFRDEYVEIEIETVFISIFFNQREKFIEKHAWNSLAFESEKSLIDVDPHRLSIPSEQADGIDKNMILKDLRTFDSVYDRVSTFSDGVSLQTLQYLTESATQFVLKARSIFNGVDRETLIEARIDRNSGQIQYSYNYSLEDRRTTLGNCSAADVERLMERMEENLKMISSIYSKKTRNRKF